jgi:hypothetical protein
MMRWFFWLIATVSLSACQTVPSAMVSVDGLSSPAAAGAKTYYLAPAENFVSTSDLQFVEFSGQIERALASRGLTRVGLDAASSPDMFVFLDYGIGKPRKRIGTYSIPHWGQTGVQSSYTTGTVSPSGYYSATTTYTPSYGITGYSTGVYEYSTYTRHIMLDAIFADGSARATPAFRTSIVSEGTSGDLRQMFPIMLLAARDHLAANTGSALVVEVKFDDKRIAEITGIAPSKKK